MTKEAIETFDYNPIQEKIVKVLQNKNQMKADLFYRILVTYYLSKVASMMRTSIDTNMMGVIPVNTYALVLATSGAGKGKSVNFMENSILKGFETKFKREVLPEVVDKNLAKLAAERASLSGLDPDEVYMSLQKEYKATGPYLFNFDGGTAAAIKQLRHKLLLGNIGSMNLEMDEVGANLSSNIDMLNVFIELYDVGKVKPKITKNTADNKRNEDVGGITPANMLLFGTPSKLLDGSKTEQDFYSLLDMGYARRLIFAYLPKINKDTSLTPEEILDAMMDSSTELIIEEVSKKIEELAHVDNTHNVLTTDRPVLLELIKYKNFCESRAESLKEHQEMEKAELAHRYFRALKIAGTYAFVEGNTYVSLDNLRQAIKLLEDSGEAFKNILKREKAYVKLAKYIAELDEDVTHADLVEDLPFYRGSATQKRELLDLAIAWGYKNSIIIKKHLIDGIEFLKGEALKETDINEIILSYSSDMTYKYVNEKVKWKDLPKLFPLENYHWLNHHLTDGHRRTSSAIPGFNIIVLDVDEGVNIKTAQELLSDYTYYIYTTKRHTSEHNRFRVIIPLTHIVTLGSEEFKSFMNNVFNWLPFKVDTASNQIVKKWLTNPDAEIYSNEGELLNAMMFIPNTKKAEEMNQERNKISHMTNMEAWFYKEANEGQRNKMMFRYAMALKDNGYDLESVKNAVLAFNSKLPEPIEEREIYDTIIVSLAKSYH